MVNIIVPIIDKTKKFDNILIKLSEVSDLNILVGVNEDLYSDIVSRVGENENITFVKFAKGSKREAIINSLQNLLKSGSILVMRKPLTMDEVNKFIYSKRDIATCKREHNGLKSLIFGIWQKILKFILGLKLYSGDTSAIFLGEDISAVVAASGNLSFSSRVNRWRGIEETTFHTKGEAVKSEFDKKDIIKFSVTSILSLLIAIIVTTCIAIFAEIGIVAGLLLICLDLICLAISLIMIVLLIFNITVGKKNIPNAMEIDENFLIVDDDESSVDKELENLNEDIDEE